MDTLQVQIYQAIYILEIAKQFQGRKIETDLKKVAKEVLEDCVKGVFPGEGEETAAPAIRAPMTPPFTSLHESSDMDTQGMPELEEVSPEPHHPPLTHSPIQLSEPVQNEDLHTETNTSVQGVNKKDFTRWCKTLGLEQGHPFFYIKGGQSVQVFHLGYRREGTAYLHTTCADGTVLNEKSPSGILKAYLRKVTNKDRAITDAWSRLSMQSPNGLTKWAISERTWLNYEWNSKTKKFDSIL
jgi:hypothetical protein